MRDPVITFDPNLLRSNVPEALRALRQWVAWQYVERNGKQTKCPMIPTKGGAASSTNPGTWATFEEAIAACKAPGLEGIGFVFSADDTFAGIDLDNCLDAATGEVKPWAWPILDQLDSYTEVSPSGKGVKVFVRASKPGPRCKSRYEDGAIEMYDRGRFFTVTGVRLPDRPTDVEARQAAFDAVYA